MTAATNSTDDPAASLGPNGDDGARSSGRRRRRRRRASRRRAVLLLTVSAIAVLALGEAATRVLAPYLPEPERYGDDATAVKVAQMDGDGRCADVVVAGDSMARDSFAPSTFTEADPSHRRAYNASLDAASPELLRRWLDDEVVPRLHPSTVVIDVASLDLNANGNATRSALEAYRSAEATAPGFAGRLGAWASERSYLYRYRRQLRDPAAVGDALSRWREGRPQSRRSAAGLPDVLGPDGEGRSRRSLQYRHDAGTKAFTRDQLLARYQIDDAQVRALHDLVVDLRGGGTSVVLAVLPVTADYVALHPRGGDDFDGFLASVRSVAVDTGTPLLDLHDALTDDTFFADTHHLNDLGQSWLSRSLPERLTAAGVPAEHHCP